MKFIHSKFMYFQKFDQVRLNFEFEFNLIQT